MKKLYLVIISSLLLLIGCGQDNGFKSADKPELIDFINQEIKDIDEEYAYMAALKSVFINSEEMITFFTYEEGKDKEDYILSLTSQELKQVWEKLMLYYKIANYSFYYYRDVNAASISVISISDPDRIEKLPSVIIKDLMYIHNALYVKSNGSTKMFDKEYLKIDENTIGDLVEKYKTVVLTKEDLVKQIPRVQKMILGQFMVGEYQRKRKPRPEFSYMYANYGIKVSDFIYSRIAYDLSKLQEELSIEEKDSKEEINYNEFFFNAVARYDNPSFSNALLP
jgi:hypothetical protein